MLDKKINETIDVLIKKIKENNLGSIKLSNKTNTIEISNTSITYNSNQNLQSDYQDALKDIRQRDQYREQMNFKREQAAIKNSDSKEKINIERERLATQRDIADKNLQIARENKNKYDVNSSNTEEE